MLSERDAFKVGFLSRCVEEGIAPEDIGAYVEKAAAALDGVAAPMELARKQAGLLSDVMKVPGALVDTVSRVAAPIISTIGNWGIPAAIVGPPAAGAAVGHLMSRMGDVSDEDVEAIRVKELINEYRLQSEKAERDTRVRKYRKKRNRTGRIFL